MRRGPPNIKRNDTLCPYRKLFPSPRCVIEPSLRPAMAGDAALMRSDPGHGAAVHDEGGSGDPGRVVGRQETGRAGNGLRRAQPTERMTPGEILPRERLAMKIGRAHV